MTQGQKIKDYKEKKADLKILQEILALFRMERIIYAIVITVSLLTLIFSTAYVVFTENADTSVTVITNLSSAGGIMYSAGRILLMFNVTLRAVYGDVALTSDNKS